MIAEIAKKQLEKFETSENDIELTEDLIMFVNAWNELNTSRQVGFSVGYIPYSEVIFWLNENGIFCLDERALFRYFIEVLDETYIQHARKEQESKKSSKKPPPKRQKPHRSRRPSIIRRKR